MRRPERKSLADWKLMDPHRITCGAFLCALYDALAHGEASDSNAISLFTYSRGTKSLFSV